MRESGCVGEMGAGNGRAAIRRTNPQGRTIGLVIAVIVVVGLVVFAFWSWAQYNSVEHADGYGLAGEVHPANGSAVPMVPVDTRYCPSSFCGTKATLDDYGRGVTGWAGRYTGKRGNCLNNDFQSGVWLRVRYGSAYSGETETHIAWVPYECVNWTDDHGQRVYFSTPSGKPGGASCGSVTVGQGPQHQLVGGTTDAEFCFFRAAQTCTPGELTYMEMYMDTVEVDALWVERSGTGCRILDDWATTRGSRSRLACSGARWDGSGWLLDGCGLKIWWPRTAVGAPIPTPSS